MEHLKVTYCAVDEKVLRLEGEEDAERTPSAAVLNGNLLDEQFGTCCALAAKVAGNTPKASGIAAEDAANRDKPADKPALESLVHGAFQSTGPKAGIGGGRVCVLHLVVRRK